MQPTTIGLDLDKHVFRLRHSCRAWQSLHVRCRPGIGMAKPGFTKFPLMERCLSGATMPKPSARR